MIDVTDNADGAILPVRAKPNSRSEGLVDAVDGALRVAVHAAPERGKANEAIIRVLAETLKLRKSQISLLSGETAKQKRFLVVGISATDLLNRIEAALEPTVYEPPDPDV